MSIDRTSTFFRCSRSAPGLAPSGILSDSPARQAEMLLLGAETAVSTQPVGDMAAVKEPVASGRSMCGACRASVRVEQGPALWLGARGRN